jgi:hypothetical protein
MNTDQYILKCLKQGKRLDTMRVYSLELLNYDHDWKNLCMLTQAGSWRDNVIHIAFAPLQYKKVLLKANQFRLIIDYVYYQNNPNPPPNIVSVNIAKNNDNKIVELQGPFTYYRNETEIPHQFLKALTQHCMDSIITLAQIHNYHAGINRERYDKLDELKWQHIQQYGIQVDFQGVIRTPIPETFIPQKGLIYQLFEEYGYNTNP